MRGRSQTYNVQNGRIRVNCSRCGKKRYVVVPTGIRKKSVRCTCGMTMQLTLNHRLTNREAACGKAQVILNNNQICSVFLCDMSLGGIGFTLPRQFARAVSLGQEISIKYRTGGGATAQRKARIKSLKNNRAGAQFLDGYRPRF